MARLPVVATTSIIGDVAAQVGGARVNVRVLLPTGADPHAYEPRPQDIAALTDAELVLVNGLGLEETLSIHARERQNRRRGLRWHPSPAF